MFTRLPELFTGLTNLLIFFCCIFFLWGINNYPSKDKQHDQLWRCLFFSLLLAAAWGTINHCFTFVRASQVTYTWIWRGQTVLLNLTALTFALGPCYDAFPRLFRIFCPLLILAGIGSFVFTLATLQKTGSYLTVFAWYAILCLSLASFSAFKLMLTKRGKMGLFLLLGMMFAFGAGLFMLYTRKTVWDIGITVDGNTPCHFLILLTAFCYYLAHLQSRRR